MNFEKDKLTCLALKRKKHLNSPLERTSLGGGRWRVGNVYAFQRVTHGQRAISGVKQHVELKVPGKGFSPTTKSNLENMIKNKRNVGEGVAPNPCAALASGCGRAAGDQRWRLSGRRGARRPGGCCWGREGGMRKNYTSAS